MKTKRWLQAISFVVAGAAMALAGEALPGRAVAADSDRDYFRSAAFDEPMRSIELQYFRVPRDQWAPLIARMAQYHANVISTYVHWGFHEYEEGVFDFTGATLPERDLVGFIELCAKHHLLFILKPGPFIDAETNAGGIPQWLFRNYPETVAKSARGKTFIHGDSKMPRISYLHPTYLGFVERYYRELGKAVAQYQWPHGPIVAVQVDNETPGDGFTTFANYLGPNFKADYNDYYVETAWPEWLEARYQDIDRLNAAYDSDYVAFAEVPMLRAWIQPRTPAALERYKDLNRFGEWQYVEALRRFRALLEAAGFTVPTYQDLLCMPWDLAGQIGDAGGMAEASGGWIGSNVYAEVFRPWTVFVGGPGYGYNWDEYVHMAAWRTKLTGTLSEPYPAFVPEITASSRFYFLAPIAWGADAVNVYVGWQTPVDNPLTSPKGSWGMEACVTAGGEVRDCFWNGKCAYLFMERAGAFKPGSRRPKLALGYSHEPEHAWNWAFKFNFDRPHQPSRLRSLQAEVAGTNTNDRCQLIARELIKRGIDFDAVHFDHLAPEQLERYEVVIVPTAPGGPAQGQSITCLSLNLTVFIGPGEDDLAVIKALDLDDFRESWADAPDVDVIERVAPEPGGPVVVSIVNRSKRVFEGGVYFQAGADTLEATLGPLAIGMVAVERGSIRAALLDHAAGQAEVRYLGERVAFGGTFATVANRTGFSLVTAVDSGQVSIESRLAPTPARLVRLALDGGVREEDFSYDPVSRRIDFQYDAGLGDDRADLYVLLGEGVTLDDAIGSYLARLGAGR